MTDQPLLTARTATPANLPAVATSATEALDVELRRATAISKATQALPQAYRQNPGAVLLADQWARSRGVDTLTAIQTVSFVNGKPVVDASMQVALAERAGYDIELLDHDDQHAVVKITKPNGRQVTETYTIGDAETAGLASKDNWQKNRKAMLVAAARRTAIRNHAPTVLLGLLDPDEIVDPVDTLRPAEPAAPTVEPPAPAPEPDPVDDDVVDAELVPDPTPTAPGEITKDDLRAALRTVNVRQGDAIRHAQEIAGDGVEVHNLDGIVDAGLAQQVIDWANAGEEPF